MAPLISKALPHPVSSLKPLEAGRAGECWVGEGAPREPDLRAPGEEAGRAALCWPHTDAGNSPPRALAKGPHVLKAGSKVTT